MINMESGAADFTNKLYVEYMSKPIGDARTSEWTLFQTGYYEELGYSYPKGAALLDTCVDVMNEFLKNNVRYYRDYSELVWNDIEESRKF